MRLWSKHIDVFEARFPWMIERHGHNATFHGLLEYSPNWLVTVDMMSVHHKEKSRMITNNLEKNADELESIRASFRRLYNHFPRVC